jgi:hypothetical protein
MRLVLICVALLALLACVITEFLVLNSNHISRRLLASCTLALISSLVLLLILSLKREAHASPSTVAATTPVKATQPEPPVLQPTPPGINVSSPMTENRETEATGLLDNGPWLKLVGECVDLVDEFDRHLSGLDEPQRDLAEHTISRVQEALERSGVEVILTAEEFDRKRHQPDGSRGPVPSDAMVAEVLSPGFAIGPRVFRRARVRLATRPG